MDTPCNSPKITRSLTLKEVASPVYFFFHAKIKARTDVLASTEITNCLVESDLI